MNFCSEGVANTREWIAREFEHQKGSDLCADFWHLATEVDFMLDRCFSEQEKLAMLAAEDTLELKLRRLASKVHEMRTGDKDAALHMLAITVPGRKRDVAPGWMIADAQTHSKNFHQQHERVTKRGGGGGSSYAGGRGGGQPTGGGPLLREKAAARVMARKVTEVASQVAEAAAAEASDGAQRRAGRSQRRTDGLQPQDRVEQAQDLFGCFAGVQSPAGLLL
jgi:hypothetical protein